MGFFVFSNLATVTSLLDIAFRQKQAVVVKDDYCRAEYLFAEDDVIQSYFLKADAIKTFRNQPPLI